MSTHHVGLEKSELLRLLGSHFRAPADVATGPGWWPIIADCHRQLEKHFPSYELLAVKQKYGVLAFQAFVSPWREGIDWASEDMRQLDEIIEAAQDRSAEICERCGASGELRERDRYYMTRCSACFLAETGRP